MTIKCYLIVIIKKGGFHYIFISNREHMKNCIEYDL